MVKRRYSNERDFLNSLGKTVREFYLNIFDFCDENGLKRKLETTGYSVKFVKYKGQYTPIFWMIGGGEVQDAETIILPYDMMTGFTDEQIANYKLGIWRLDFYIKIVLNVINGY